MKEIVVDSRNAGQKIEKFVRRYLNEAPLGFIYKAFRKKDIKINGHWVKRDAVVSEGDVVRIYVTDAQLAEFKQERPVEKAELPYPIVYEDDQVLIVDKPSGVLVTGTETEKRDTLARRVLDHLYLKGEFDPSNHTFVPSPAHRLDRNTAGLVIFGKTDAALKELEELFKEKEDITKKYLALVAGRVEEDGEIDAPLKKNPETGMVSVCPISKGGKSALTKYKVLERFPNATLVEATIITGRTHQIRVHFQSIGHPVIGDGKYGDFALNRQFKIQFDWDYQFLRARTLSFGKLKEPLAYLSGKTFLSPLSEKENNVLRALREGDD